MSRSGYSDNLTSRSLNMWQGAVRRAICGKRGQDFLRDFIATLDAMPVKKLAAHSFQTEQGEVCSLGAVCVARGIAMSGFLQMDDWHEDYVMDRDTVGAALNIAPAMAAEIVFNNDDGGDDGGPWYDKETDEQRWQRMRAWAVSHLVHHAYPDDAQRHRI